MAEIHKQIKSVFLPRQKYINQLNVYFFHGRNTLNDLVYHLSSYFTRVLFDRDSHSASRPHVGTDPVSVRTLTTGGNMLCGR